MSMRDFPGSMRMTVPALFTVLFETERITMSSESPEKRQQERIMRLKKRRQKKLQKVKEQVVKDSIEKAMKKVFFSL